MASRERMSKKRYLEIYRKLLLVRKFEEKVDELFRAGVIYGTVHTSVGQEAVAVGVSLWVPVCVAVAVGVAVAVTLGVSV